MNREFIPKDKIPTAEEFLSDHINRVVFPWINNWIEDNNQEAQTILECMIEFTKLHVKAALRSASNVYLKGEIDQKAFDKMGEEILSEEAEEFNRNSIRNAYPLSNIK